MVEWIKYAAYGTPFALPKYDVTSDGARNSTDTTAIGTLYGGGGYDVRADGDLDGDLDSADWFDSLGLSSETLGRSVLSSSAVANRHGYAGYENDGAITRFAHVRNRVLDSTLGRWTRRDPIGYVDGMGLYAYGADAPVGYTDPMGLACTSCSTSTATASFRAFYEQVMAQCRAAGRDALSISCCSSNFASCKAFPNACAVTTRGPYGSSICLCLSANCGGAGPPTPLALRCGRPVCEVIRHELMHVWQNCSQTPTLPPGTSPAPGGVGGSDTSAICAEISAWGNVPGHLCSEHLPTGPASFCNCMCGHAFPNNPNCPALCAWLFNTCINWRPGRGHRPLPPQEYNPPVINPTELPIAGGKAAPI
jgi:RHS repeat-associated protein